jgi:hypothetical protein
MADLRSAATLVSPTRDLTHIVETVADVDAYCVR